MTPNRRASEGNPRNGSVFDMPQSRPIPRNHEAPEVVSDDGSRTTLKEKQLSDWLAGFVEATIDGSPPPKMRRRTSLC